MHWNEVLVPNVQYAADDCPDNKSVNKGRVLTNVTWAQLGWKWYTAKEWERTIHHRYRCSNFSFSAAEFGALDRKTGLKRLITVLFFPLMDRWLLFAMLIPKTLL